jgi:hypothetical protein
MGQEGGPEAGGERAAISFPPQCRGAGECGELVDKKTGVPWIPGHVIRATTGEPPSPAIHAARTIGPQRASLRAHRHGSTQHEHGRKLIAARSFHSVILEPRRFWCSTGSWAAEVASRWPSKTRSKGSASFRRPPRLVAWIPSTVECVAAERFH